MTLPVTGIGHIALRVTDRDRAKACYTEALGFTLVGGHDRACFVTVGGAVFALLAGTEVTPADDRFNPFRVGLDHLALAVQREALPDLQQRLTALHVRNSGIEHDAQSGTGSITFYDPDGSAWECYAQAWRNPTGQPTEAKYDVASAGS